MVAIIGLLSAIAVPAYRDYVDRAKIRIVIDQLIQVSDRAKEFYDKNGFWPNATQLGYTSSDNLTLDNASDLAPYIQAASFSEEDAGGGCAGRSTRFLSWVQFDPNQIPLTDNGSHYAYYQLGTTPDDIMVSYCSDHSTTALDWVGRVCTYTNGNTFQNSICD